MGPTMTLKAKLVVFNLLNLFVIGLLLFVQFRVSQNRQKQEIRENFAENTRRLDRDLGNRFNILYYNVQNFALNASKLNSLEEVSTYFEDLVSLYPLYTDLLYVSKSGELLASNKLDKEGNRIDRNISQANIKQTNWFNALSEGKLSEDYDKRIIGAFFEPRQNGFSGEQVSVFATYITSKDGKIIGYLATYVNENWISHELLNASNSLKSQGFKDAQIWLLGKENNTLFEVKGDKLVGSQAFTTPNVSEFTTEKNQKSYFELAFMPDNNLLNSFEKVESDKIISTVPWKIFINVNSDHAFTSIDNATNLFFMSIFVVLLVGSFLSYFISSKLVNRLLNVAKKVESGSIEILDASNGLSKLSKNLSQSTNEEAAGLQQTVASLNEINAMVVKNTDASKNSKELSSKSRKAAEVGKSTIDKMVGAIDEISDSNTEIVNQLQSNSSEIQEIISVIQAIEEKTKVINDIVFQTKLLSFNASVEAARAGEHGKGFSVVAEEVGNLAQHSGDAAKEIELMLSESVTKVESIAKNTESKVGELIEKGLSKVNQGKEVASQCDNALGEILTYAHSLDQMIEEITTASIEQTQGINEISMAMSELDHLTKGNSRIAQDASQSTLNLNSQAESLKNISKDLTSLILGQVIINTNVDSSKEDKKVAVLKPKIQDTKKVVLKNETKPSPQTDTAKTNNVISMKPKQEVKKPLKEVVKPKNEKVNVVKETSQNNVANSDISIPQHNQGDWEDI